MRRASAFPLRVRFEVILMDHNYTHFGAESRSLRPHYTQLYTPPYDLDGCPPWRTRTRMHMGSLLTCRPRFSQVGLGRVDTKHAPHPLGNYNQFQGFVYVSIRMTLLFHGYGFNLARALRVGVDHENSCSFLERAILCRRANVAEFGRIRAFVASAPDSAESG